MKKDTSDRPGTDQDDMLAEYDLSGKKAERGRYYRACREGYTVEIKEDDGTVKTQHFTLHDGAVMLDPDVRAYFPDSESVNKALRSLIALIPTRDTRR
jgi:hypothetical protein